MKIVCATSLTDGEAAFRTIGDVLPLPERDIRAESVRDADALVVRSKVRVDAKLLAGSRVRFVGTATAGTDHFDLAWLRDSGITWSAAPGCNANGVAEYVTAALLRLSVQHRFALSGRVLGIIGAGHVGTRVAQQAQALGLRVLLNDPPLRRSTGEDRFRPLDEVLEQSDILTLHVPLHDDAPDATRAMVDAAFLSRLRKDVILINACRGEVIREEALLDVLQRKRIRHLVLDVFDREPFAAPALMERADLISPHIAGYSHQGKLNGTAMIYSALCRFAGQSERWSPPLAQGLPTLRADPDARTKEERLWSIVRQAYDPAVDDQALRTCIPLQESERGRHFETLRQQYRVRHEFNQYRVSLATHDQDLQPTLGALGFRTSGSHD